MGNEVPKMGRCLTWDRWKQETWGQDPQWAIAHSPGLLSFTRKGAGAGKKFLR